MMPLRHIATNLRHEILPVLAIIHQELTKMDNRISQRSIDTEKPTNNILGATMIMDIFIKMIMGVTEFHPRYSTDRQPSRRRSLHNILQTFFSIYSLLRNRRRAEGLELNVNFNREILVEYGSELIEYIVAILLDNVWKYSHANTNVTVELSPHIEFENLADLKITNLGLGLPDDLDIFAAGAKANLNSSCFGYGLYWAKILVRHYNTLRPDSRYVTDLTHAALAVAPQEVAHTFTLSNIIIRR